MSFKVTDLCANRRAMHYFLIAFISQLNLYLQPFSRYNA